MAIRTFIFCDMCNPLGVRSIELRRRNERSRTGGRRITDGRAWFEGLPGEAQQGGWCVSNEGQHVCPTCRNRLTRMHTRTKGQVYSFRAASGGSRPGE